MVPAMAKAQTSSSRKLKAEEGFAAAAEPLPAGKRPGDAGPAPSLRDRLAEFFRAGQNGSDRELAALFGASVGSISVYRCQLKKLGIGVASPPVARGAAGKGERRSAGRKAGPLGKRPTASRAAKALSGGRADSEAGRGGALSLGEIDQVLLQNIETELGLIVERYPDLARPVANVEQTVRLLLKLHR